MEKEQRTYDETIEQHEDAQSEQASEEQVENEETQQEEKDELALAYEKIAQLEAKLAETENRFLRLHADFDNYRRRVRLDMEAAEKYRAQSLVSDLLPILDNFERALQVQVEDEKAKSLLQGMEMVYRSLIEALKKKASKRLNRLENRSIRMCTKR